MFAKKADPAEAQENHDWREIIPQNLCRSSIEETLAVVVKSYEEARRLIGKQGHQKHELKEENEFLRGRIAELAAELSEHEQRDRAVALLSVLATTEGGTFQ